MRLIDERGRVFGKVNIIDLMVLLIILLGAAGGFYLKVYRHTDKVVTLDKRVTYDLEVKSKTDVFVDMVKVGDSISDDAKGNYLGKIIDKKVSPATLLNTDNKEGKFVKVPVPDRYDIVLTLEAKGTVTAESVQAEGIDIKIGKGLLIKGKGYSCQGYIIGIKAED